MNNEYVPCHGDIVLARNSDGTSWWVGVVTQFMHNGNPKVMFWNAHQNRMAGMPLVMLPEGLTYVGNVPDWADWDV